MTEQANPVDKISRINYSLDSLWQKYGKDNRYKSAERENGRRLLTQLGVTQEAMTVIKACGILDDIIFEQVPKDAINLPDIIPTIAQAISHIREEASKKQLDLKTELITTHTFLSTIEASDQEVYVDDTEGRLSSVFYDKTFTDLLNSVGNAIRYF